MKRQILAMAGVAGSLLAGCGDAASQPSVPPPQETAAPGGPPCRGNVLRNPLFGIGEPQAPSTIEAPVARTNEIGQDQAMWAWRSWSGSPRWTGQGSNTSGPLYLARDQAVFQDAAVAPGRWRVVITAAASPAAPASLRGQVDGPESFAFDLPLGGTPMTFPVDLDLPQGADRLILTGLGPGEARLMMVCLRPLD